MVWFVRRRHYSFPTCLRAAAAAKGARAMAPSDRAHRTRNGLRNGAPPPLAADAAATPKISTGIVSGRTRIAMSRPPRLSETVSAAPIAPIIVSAGVPAASVAATSASGKGAIASMSPNSGLKTTSGNALAVQCAAHFTSTTTSSGGDPLIEKIERTVLVIGLEQPVEPQQGGEQSRDPQELPARAARAD